MSVKNTGFVIRRANKQDMLDVAEMIAELETYHNSDGIPKNKLSVKDLQKDGFESEPPAFRCIVAEVKKEEDMSIVGYALYYQTYSSREGVSLLLEDLFVKVHERHHGIGTSLFDAVVKEAYLTECSRVDFHVVGWNRARSFYERKGAVNLSADAGLCYCRLSGAALRAAAEGGDQDRSPGSTDKF